MSTRAERLLAGRQIVLKMLLAELAELDGQIREALEPLIDPDGGISAELPDGTRVGSVKRSKPAMRARCYDQGAYLAWVREHRPDELDVSVRAGFTATVKGWVKRYGNAVYPATGEIIPGWEWTQGSASYLPRTDETTVDIVMERIGDLIAEMVGPRAIPPARIVIELEEAS